MQLHWHADIPVIRALADALGIDLPIIARDDTAEVARRAARLRELEQSFGVSTDRCIWKDCSRFALRGTAICAEHYGAAR